VYTSTSQGDAIALKPTANSAPGLSSIEIESEGRTSVPGKLTSRFSITETELHQDRFQAGIQIESLQSCWNRCSDVQCLLIVLQPYREF